MTFEPSTGNYEVQYIGFDDTVHITTLLPGNRAAPRVSATVTINSQNRFSYSYEVYNDSLALAGLREFEVVVSESDSIAVPQQDGWSTIYTTSLGRQTWYQSGDIGNELAPASSLSGFGLIDSGIPSIVRGFGASLRYLAFDDEGPTGDLRRELDSLDLATAEIALITIAPRDPPSPFDLGDFLDTLGTYPLRAAAEGWIADSTAGELDRLLNDASSALSGGDSTWTATLLGTVLNHVEEIKDDSLTGEGYALMKYNIEYALGNLPGLVPIKVFLEGPYASGQEIMLPTNDSTPLVQPFGDESLPYNYGGTESVTRFPNFVADWIHVMLIDVSGTWTVEYARPALLSKTGFAYPAFPSSVSGDYLLAVAEYNHVYVASDTVVTISNGSAGHDFTHGAGYSDNNQPQRPLSGGVYVMWAGDGTQDGQVTALDFTLWLAASTAGATGYEPADYNRDQVVTGPDEDLWLANTTAGARAPHVLSDAIHAIPPLQSGPMTFGAGSPTSQLRLNVTRDDRNDFWVSVEARADTSLLPDNTVGSATIDVNYDASKMAFQSSDTGVLAPQNGYRVTTVDVAESSQHFVRLSIDCSGIA
ncbi:MAG: hypothetical protein WBW88_01195, partial [Rhodothermales bacterium]